MTYIVAVSGGIDSVALLHMMQRVVREPLVVAHFDHGIRSESRDDAAFVERLAKEHGLPFELRREELGPNASEAFARERRYKFLRDLAVKYGGKVVTAHHADDVVETTAINLMRGTGWRGLAVLDSDVYRPLIGKTKQDIRRYAQLHGLRYREDSTNASDAYLRNRIRPKVAALHPDIKKQVHALHMTQKGLKREIETEVRQLVGCGPEYSRYIFIHMPAIVALECLRVITRGRLTRPQLERALLAVKTARTGAKYEAGGGVVLHFSTRIFSL